MGTYAGEPALRAMATMEEVTLVVINSKSGPRVPGHEKNRPKDQVHIYWPERAGAGLLKVVKAKSWACDVVPTLLKEKGANAKPCFRVIIHNGEPPGSPSGHFEATHST